MAEIPPNIELKSGRKLSQKNQCLQHFAWRPFKWCTVSHIISTFKLENKKKIHEKKYFTCFIYVYFLNHEMDNPIFTFVVFASNMLRGNLRWNIFFLRNKSKFKNFHVCFWNQFPNFDPQKNMQEVYDLIHIYWSRLFYLSFNISISAEKFLLYDHSNKKKKNNLHPTSQHCANQIKSNRLLFCYTDSTFTISSENHTEIIVPAMRTKEKKPH